MSEESAEAADTTRQQDSADHVAGSTFRPTRRRPTVKQRNAETAPPDGERVTFRSVTLAEMYYAHQADQLTEKLRTIRWTDIDEPLAEQIAIARRDDTPCNSEFLLRSDASSHPKMRGLGKTALPTGIDRIVGQVHVLGPSLVAVVLTFVLEDNQAIRLDEALRSQVGAESPESQSRAALRNVFVGKYERVEKVLDDVADRCQNWLKNWVPGTLASGDGQRMPACSLISLAEGQPFQTPDDYMRLLSMSTGVSGAMRFARPDYIFLMNLGARKRRRNLTASFNEQQASETWPDVEGQPEILHENLHPYMTVLALEGVLDSFEARMRSTRSALAGFNLGDRQKEGATTLRDYLLELSRDIAVACGDIKGATDDRTAASLWADYPLLLTAASGDPLGDALDPGAVPRRNLAEVMRDLRNQETELRELILVTSQAASDAQNVKTASSLNKLTIWLVVLTIVLVGLGVVTLIQSLTHSSDGGSGDVIPSSSPAPAHTAHDTSIPRPSASPKDTRSATASASPVSP